MSIWGAHREVDNNSSVLASMAATAKVDLSASFKFNSGNPVNDAKAVAPALEQSAAGLSNIQDMRRTLAASIDHGSNAGGAEAPSAKTADPANPMSFFRPGNLALSVGSTVAGLAIGGPIGAGIMAAGAVSDAIGFMAGKTGTEHAGLGHAGTKNTAIDGGKSEFTSAPSSDEKGGYVDVLGTRWADDGSQIAINNQVAPKGPAANPQMQMAADETVAKFGEKEVMRQLGQTSTMEKRLLQQAGSAMDFAEDHGGPQKIALNYRPFAGGPAAPGMG
ncbi:MAG: hypothetical protein WC043_10410 [Pseudobdellovibrionaceae bacterium]